MKRMLARAFRRRREIPCSAQKIPCRFPAGRKITPCSPTQGILLQAPRIQGLFGAYLGEKVRIPCKFAARREFFPLAYPRQLLTPFPRDGCGELSQGRSRDWRWCDESESLGSCPRAPTFRASRTRKRTR